MFASAGLYWKEDAETYESSFYKRSLDNDLYIFTPTAYVAQENSESAQIERLGVCQCVYVLIYSLSFNSLAASDDSVLVSRAVNLQIKGVTLKPAGKDTHRHRRDFYLHLMAVISQMKR